MPEPGRAPHVDLAAVLLDDPVDERESEPGPFRLGGEEGLEDVGDVGGGDPVAGVAHRDLERLAANGGGDAQLAALRHGLDGVQAEIPEDLPELLRVDGPRDGRRRTRG